MQSTDEHRYDLRLQLLCVSYVSNIITHNTRRKDPRTR